MGRLFFSSVFDLDVAFYGWAIAILIFILTICSGTIVLRRISISQKQKAGKNAEQSQKVNSSSIKDETTITQTQKAKDGAKQSQSV